MPNRKLKKRGRKRKITGYNLSLLKKFVDSSNEDKSAKNQQEIAEEYRDRDLKLHRSTISRTLTREGQVYKIASKQYSELDIEKAKQFIRDKYWLYSYSHCFALDEFGFHLNEAFRRVCFRKGCRAKIIQPGEKGCHYTVILCVQNLAGQGKIKVSYKPIKNVIKKTKKKNKETEKKGTKAVDLHDFLAGVNFPNNCYILLDNAKIHHAVKSCIKEGRLPIKELAIKKGIILEYLPSHAPMINPAEFCINFIKGFIRRKQPRTDEEVKTVVSEAMNVLQQKDLTEFFLHCRDILNVKLNHKSGK